MHLVGIYLVELFSTFKGGVSTPAPLKMEHTDCSETSKYKTLTPGNNPKARIQLLDCHRCVLQLIDSSPSSFQFHVCAVFAWYMLRPFLLTSVNGLLGNDTVCSGQWLPTFWREIFPAICRGLKFEAALFVHSMQSQRLNFCTFDLLLFTVCFGILLTLHSFSSLSYDRSKASSKASSPHSAIQSFLFQMRVSSPFLKVIQ